MNSKRQEILEMLDKELAELTFRFGSLSRADLGDVTLLVGPASHQPTSDHNFRHQVTVMKGFPPDEDAVRRIPFWLLRKRRGNDWQLRYLGGTNRVGHLSFRSVADHGVKYRLRVSIPKVSVHQLKLPGHKDPVNLRRLDDRWEAEKSLNWFGTRTAKRSLPFFLRWYDLRILIAEDNLHTRQVTTKTLVSAGAQVTGADDGLQALEMVHNAELEGAPFDAVIMDLRMPKLDGCHATQRLRAAGYDRPIIGLTAADDFEKAYPAGCDDCVVKTGNSHSRLIQVLRSKLSEHLKNSTNSCSSCEKVTSFERASC